MPGGNLIEELIVDDEQSVAPPGAFFDRAKLLTSGRQHSGPGFDLLILSLLDHSRTLEMPCWVLTISRGVFVNKILNRHRMCSVFITYKRACFNAETYNTWVLTA